MLHGETQLRGNNPPESQFHARGRFGRLFSGLPPFAPDNEKVRKALFEMGKRGGLMDAKDPAPGQQPAPDAKNEDNDTISAGFTFFGQFADHDLTFDPTSILERQNDPEAIENFRTPAFELDNVYGAGPRVSRHLYDVKDPAKFLVEKLGGPDSQDDLPRNSQNTALIADPRNDENVIVSQLHLAMIKFHNAIVDRLRAKGVPGQQVFDQAQRMVRWHYQWILLKEFLPKIVGEAVVKDVLRDHPKDRLFQWRNEPFIPVEFSVAAYRFGHSQVRPGYRMNTSGPFAAAIFNNTLPADNPDPNDMRGGKRAPRRFVEWENFFSIGDPTRRQLSKRIDTRISSGLFGLPGGAPGQPSPDGGGTLANPESLAQRNLLRGLALRLPSGQAMAKRMGIKPLKPEQLEELKQFGVGFESSTPPWYYMLRESELEKGNEGKHLGPVGARIVAEVFIGVLQGDRFSFLNANPHWRPELGNGKGEFTIGDLLKIAGAKLTA
ncbi:peroxidase [Archangium violaceum]|uniref:peroxidase family protein n=1 Tax=Archangium violaceum TaxID=83451 RepID=UPI00194E9A8E|nr:heme peroxidase family protein [Archangium violaceum]QRN95087.1 peroxidase [Archangium violaceum]